MHAKTDSEGTSIDVTWPHSPRRLLYYVQSPSNNDAEKMSYGSSPAASPAHNYGNSSPFHHHHHHHHHSRDSSASRFSDPHKNDRTVAGWKKLSADRDLAEESDLEMDGQDSNRSNVRLYLCIFFFFMVIFSAFCLILWSVSRSYPPHVLVKSMLFENFYVQAGNDRTGVPTDMLSLNCTVRIHYRNPATFFAVHVTSTPFQLCYYQLQVASGQMKKFSQPRKSERTVVVVAQAQQVPLYGGVPLFGSAREHADRLYLPLNLTFVMRSRAYVLGRLVRSKFYKHVRCPVAMSGKKLGHPINLMSSCTYA